MADLAKGANCPVCGTLVTCAGKFTDAQLVGQCPVDSTYVTVANVVDVAEQYVATNSLSPAAAAIASTDPAPTQQGA